MVKTPKICFSSFLRQKNHTDIKKIKAKYVFIQKSVANKQIRRNHHRESAKPSPGIPKTGSQNDQIVFN